MASIAQAAVPGAAASAEGVRVEAGTIPALDGLRGLSVVWIVLFHYSVLRDAASDPWAAMLRDMTGLGAIVAHGPFAVELFFLISGFLLTLPWISRHHDAAPAPDTKRFYARRIRRIVPAYYAHLAALFIVVMPWLHGMRYWRSDLYVDAFNAVAHALFLQNLSPLTSGSLGANGALWTLAVEAQFYALLPLLAPVFVRAPWRSLAASAAISTAWIAASRYGFDAVVRWHLEIGRHWQWSEATIRSLLAIQLPAYLFDFALGAAMARLWLLQRAPVLRHRATILGAGTVLLIGALAESFPPDAMRMVAVVALAGAMLAAAAGPSSILDQGPLAFVGRISYSAYLWHLPLLLCLQRLRSLDGAGLLPLYLGAVLVTAWLSWWAIERHFRPPRERASASPPPSP